MGFTAVVEHDGAHGFMKLRMNSSKTVRTSMRTKAAAAIFSHFCNNGEFECGHTVGTVTVYDDGDEDPDGYIASNFFGVLNGMEGVGIDNVEVGKDAVDFEIINFGEAWAFSFAAGGNDGEAMLKELMDGGAKDGFTFDKLVAASDTEVSFSDDVDPGSRDPMEGVSIRSFHPGQADELHEFIQELVGEMDEMDEMDDDDAIPPDPYDQTGPGPAAAHKPIPRLHTMAQEVREQADEIAWLHYGSLGAVLEFQRLDTYLEERESQVKAHAEINEAAVSMAERLSEEVSKLNQGLRNQAAELDGYLEREQEFCNTLETMEDEHSFGKAALHTRIAGLAEEKQVLLDKIAGFEAPDMRAQGGADYTDLLERNRILHNQITRNNQVMGLLRDGNNTKDNLLQLTLDFLRRPITYYTIQDLRGQIQGHLDG